MKDGWEVKALGEVCIVKRGTTITKKQTIDGEVPVIGGGTKPTYFHNQPNRDANCITISGSGASAGYVNSWTIPIFASDCSTVETRQDTQLQRFVYYYLLSQQSYIYETLRSGAAQPHVYAKDIAALGFPIVRIEEQKRIVSILDEAFEGLDRARENAEANLKSASELFANLLNATFESNNEQWTHSNLGAACQFIGGSQPPKANFTSEDGEGLIRLVQIRDYKSDKNITFIPRSLARRFCTANDVMIGRYGPPLFQILRGIEGAYNVALMKAEPNPELLSKDYLYFFLRNGRILKYIIDASNRAAGQIGLNKATIEPYPISYPNLAEQSRIVAELEKAEIHCKSLETKYRTKLQDISDLRQSLLQKAFAGELT